MIPHFLNIRFWCLKHVFLPFTQALRRLGGKNTMSASERLKAKKKGTIGKEVNKVEDSLHITKAMGCYVVAIGRGAG